MKSIWKFPLELREEQVVEMPLDSKILSVADQGGQIVIWAEVYTEHRTEQVFFHIFGTGAVIPPSRCQRHYIGTVQLNRLVWHIYRVEV